MCTTLRQMFENLEKCTEKLEEDVKNSWKEVVRAAETFNENDMVLDRAVDYHYKEILSHLKEMRVHIGIIAHHDKQIHSLQTKIKSTNNHARKDSVSKIDKNYIKRQVEAFQITEDQEPIHKRDKKHVRISQASSMKYLESWENYLEHQKLQEVRFTESAPVKKRGTDSVRKKKKFVSSTLGTFLESPLEDCSQLESVDEKTMEDAGENSGESPVEAVNPDICKEEGVNGEENVLDTRPKIVDVICKHEELDGEESLPDSRPKIVDVILKKKPK